MMKLMQIAQITLAAGLLFGACHTHAETNAETDIDDTSAARGEHVFEKHCALCHGNTGAGIEPWYPSLQRLAAIREPQAMVETVITGRFRRAGDMNGHTIPIMPAWGQLSDADVAAIINYIQQNWGDGGTITSQNVADTREALWNID